jgi:hypothetical protein
MSAPLIITPPITLSPPWLLSCSRGPHRCRCPGNFKPDILCVRGLSYHSQPPSQPDPTLIIQFIEFTFCNDRFSPAAIELKTNKYQPLINLIQSHGWNVALLIVITVGAWATTHIPSIKHLHTTLKIPEIRIKQAFTNINILLYKQRIENNQTLPHVNIPP